MMAGLVPFIQNQYPIRSGGFMKTTTVRMAALGCGILAITACTRLVWTAVIEKEDKLGTIASILLPGADGHVLAAGLVEITPSEYGDVPTGNALVVRYDNAGKLQWRRELGDGNSLIGVLTMGSALDGSIYLSDARLENGLDLVEYLTRLDAAGNVLWQQPVPFGDALEFTVQTKVVNDNLIVLGRESDSYGAQSAVDTLVGFDAGGNLLWRFNGVGESLEDGNSRVDVEVLAGDRLATFASYRAADGQGGEGELIILNNNGQELLRKPQQELGLTRILDLAALDGQLVVAGTRDQGSRLMLLDADLNVVRQEDFDYGIAARLATHEGTLCFALLQSSDWEFSNLIGGTVQIGLLDASGNSWSTLQSRAVSLSGNVVADNNQCAYTDVAGPIADDQTSPMSTVVFNAKGIKETLDQTGLMLPLPIFQPTLLRGRQLTTAVNLFGDNPDLLVHQAQVKRHLVY